MGRERQIFKDEVFKLSDSENEDGPSTFQPRKERKNMQKRANAGQVSNETLDNYKADDDRDVIKLAPDFNPKMNTMPINIYNMTQEEFNDLENKYLMREFNAPGLLSSAIQKKAEERFRHGPTYVQSYVVPLILKFKRNVVVRSQTGSGKSAAFLLPLIELIYREKINKKFESTKNPYAVIFLPTRELCIQLANEAIRLCENTEVKVLFSFGGIPMVKTREMAKKGADIVIGTPARIYDLFFDEIYDPIFNLNNLKYVVLDEYDKLISGNMIKQILDFKENLPNTKHRTFLFSATESEIYHVEDLCSNKRIELKIGEEAPVERVVQTFVEIDPTRGIIVNSQDGIASCIYSKIDYLLFLLNRFVTKTDKDGYKRLPITLVFVHKKWLSNMIAIFLIQKGFRATAINSDLSTEVRKKAIDGVQTGKYDILVGTDLLSRGINIPNVATVINYTLPRTDLITYIHRIGRTGRMGNFGRAISFFEPQKDYTIASFLEKCLTTNNQPVPDFLVNGSLNFMNEVENKYLGNNPIRSNKTPQQVSTLNDEIEF